MRRTEIVLDHFYKNRFVSRKRLMPNESLTVIGQTKECHIRLLGEGVSDIHAGIDFNKNTWTVSDLGSDQGTWVKKKPIVNQVVDAVTSIQIGHHTLKMTPRLVETKLFEVTDQPQAKKQLPVEKGEKLNQYHQVVVRKNRLIVDSKLLRADEPYYFASGGTIHQMNAPKSETWTTQTFGLITVQQRLVQAKEFDAVKDEETKSDLKFMVPMLILIGVIFLFVVVSLLMPHKPESEMDQVKPDQNQFVKMIYDSKSIKKKREEAKKISNSFASATDMKTPPKDKPNAEPSKLTNNTKTAQVVSKIHAAGLSQLIGKISMRAAKNAQLVASAGVAADANVPSRASLSIGGEKSKGDEKTFKVAGVATNGKAGGSTNYKEFGALSQGNVGTATVGILEEETEVDGGLDKDVIARVIETYLGQIRYCYERQLSASPELYGKVLVKFTIGPDGLVKAQSIGSSTLKSAMVEGCILRRVTDWQFPKPKGGTNVNVTYPFLFKSTN